LLCPSLPELGSAPMKSWQPWVPGGMGEVFRAHDPRLRRTVAIKVLPRDRVADPERKRRFLQEARAASALNHPNIVTLYDIASDSSLDYLVMEYVPGQSLDKRIAPKGLPLAEAIGYATQIAGALAAAHAAGITHRDIKPGNVIVTAESQMKVLDFGLAKLADRTPPGPEGETQTQQSSLTEAGSVVGTVAYMSPEQASARPLDHRTDIFSLGIVLYEMLAGQRPFRGKSPVETMHAIIHDPAPPLAEQPPELDEILAKALAKDPKDRYQHAGDLALDLRRFAQAWASKSLLSMRGAAPAKGNKRLVTAVLLLGVAGAAWWVGHRGAVGSIDNPLASAKFTRLTNFEGSESDAALSPDGKFAVFLSDRDGPLDILLTQVGSGRFVNLTQGRLKGRKRVRTVGFSGDGSEIWLEGQPVGRMRIMPLMGGPLRPFLGERAVQAAWSPDGTRMVYHTDAAGDPMFVADRTGANAKQIFVASPGVHNHFQAWSPDGEWIYFTHGFHATNEFDIWRIAASGGEPKQLTRHHNYVGYPTPIDQRTVLYVARDQDSSGPWLWALDVERGVTRRVAYGIEQYLSVAASVEFGWRPR